MGTVTIRNLDDALIERVKARAKAAGRSMESELRRQIETANADEPKTQYPAPDYAALKALDEEVARRLGPDGRLPPGKETADYFRRRRKAIFGDRILPSSVDLIREIREEDPTVSPPDAGYL